jgi:hypothetical protein
MAQDHVGRGARERRGIWCGDLKKAVAVADGVSVSPDDLARVVDARCNGSVGSRGIVERGVGPTAIEEAVTAGAVAVQPDNLAHIVDAKRFGVAAGEEIVERKIRAAAKEEAVGATGIQVSPDDLAYC